MSAVLVSLALILIVILLIIGFRFLNRASRLRREQKFIDLFNKTGMDNGLIFSSQEILRNKIIGLDGLHRKFIVVNENEESRIIHLDDVRKCSLQKSLNTYRRPDEKTDGYEMFVKSIYLQFDFKGKQPAEKVIFYDALLQPQGEEKRLEARCKDWEIILSKMIIESP